MRIASPTTTSTPIPRCPPMGLPLYAMRLNRMSTPGLKEELSKQQMRLYVAEHGFIGNPAVAKDARAKIALVQKELASRQLNPMDYAKQVHKMSDKELTADNFYAVRAHTMHHRRTQGLARGNVEASLMQRTLDSIAVDITFGQRGEGMRAGIVGGVIGTIDIVKREHASANAYLFRLPRREIRGVTDRK